MPAKPIRYDTIRFKNVSQLAFSTYETVRSLTHSLRIGRGTLVAEPQPSPRVYLPAYLPNVEGSMTK